MRVILSRKGFDTDNGGMPSAIMPDGTMLSFPIPSYERYGYGDLQYNGVTYAELLRQLNKKFTATTCHIDPDLTDRFRVKVPDGWKPAFGPAGTADSYLVNASCLKPGDLFLFFGTFRMVEKDKRGKYRFVRKGEFPAGHTMHVIWGYLQVGEILRTSDRTGEYPWHPHADQELLDDESSTLYIPTEKLSFDKSLPGCGVFDFDEKRILTMPGKTKAVWKDNPVYRPDSIAANRKNSAKEGGIYYSGVWQELPLKETKKAEAWAMSLF